MSNVISREDFRAFGAQVRKMREEQGLTQMQLADLAGLHRTYIGGIERGERNPSLLNIHKVARAMKVRVAELFSQM